MEGKNVRTESDVTWLDITSLFAMIGRMLPPPNMRSTSIRFEKCIGEQILHSSEPLLQTVSYYCLVLYRTVH